MYPKISVITPSFRGAALIESTIQSVLSQGYPSLEYIVIDGAGDDTADLLRRYDGELAYWCSEPDRGQYDALNKGFARATGDILFWLNADDMLLPRSLFVVGEVFNKFPEIEWMSTLSPGVWDANGYLCKVNTIPGFSKAAFLDGFFLPGTRVRGCWVQQESTFFRRSLWKKAGSAIPDYPLAGDFALWCAFYRHADLVGIEYPLAGFRAIEGQRSEAVDQYTHESQAALKELRLEAEWGDTWQSRLLYSRFATLPKIRSQVTHSIGYAGRKITNRNRKRIGAHWALKAYRFLP